MLGAYPSGSQSRNNAGDEIGAIALSPANVPSDVQCIRLDVATPASYPASAQTRTFDVGPAG
jgi:hypothetical protein